MIPKCVYERNLFFFQTLKLSIQCLKYWFLIDLVSSEYYKVGFLFIYCTFYNIYRSLTIWTVNYNVCVSELNDFKSPIVIKS